MYAYPCSFGLFFGLKCALTTPSMPTHVEARATKKGKVKNKFIQSNDQLSMDIDNSKLI